MKILSYNPHTFNRTNQQYKLNNIDLYNRLLKYNFCKDVFLVDRTQSIPHFLDIDYIYSPIPTNPSFNLNFYDIVEKRCLELLSTDKEINVAWSGGIDSTFILLSLYHYANDPDQIRVYGTYNSIIESGDFFDRFIKNRMRYSIKINTTASNNFNYEQDCLYVTGAMSNQLFTPGLSYNKNRDMLLEFKDSNFIGIHDKHNKFLEKNALVDYKKLLTDECLEFLTPSILNSPKPIITLQDLRWYIIFNYTWYNVLTNNLIGLNPDIIKKVHAFFNTEDFQLWSIYNTDKATKTGDFSDDRWQLREKISEYTGDLYYSNNKKKFTSVLSPKPHSWLFLLNDYTNVYVKD
jgi:hypothetical protein